MILAAIAPNLIAAVASGAAPGVRARLVWRFVGLIADLGYTRPFLQPLPIWDYWYLLILPLSAAVAVVYKSIKCRSMNQVPRQAATITLWILISFAAAAAALAGLVDLVQKMQ